MSNRPPPSVLVIRRAEGAAAEIDAALAGLPPEWPRVASAAGFVGSGGWFLADIRGAVAAGEMVRAVELTAVLVGVAADFPRRIDELTPPRIGTVAHWPMPAVTRRATGARRCKCGTVAEPAVAEQTFRNGTTHRRATCRTCGAFLGYVGRRKATADAAGADGLV